MYSVFHRYRFKTALLHSVLLATALFTRSAAHAQQQTLTLQPDAACGKDALLHGLASEQNTNYGNQPQLPANAWTFNGTPGNVRSVLEFDLSQLPVGAVINSAYLSLYAWDQNTGMGQHNPLSGSNAGRIQRITSPWDENTVTWNTQPSVTLINQVTLPQSVSPTQDYLNINVTALVQNMLSSSTGNYGFLIRQQTEAYYRILNFCSSDHPDPSKHPKLVITYTGISSESPLNLGPDRQLCEGQSFTLDAYMTNGSYLWQDGSTAQSFTVTAPGTYYVQVTTCSGVYSDTVVVSPGNCPGPPLVSLPPDTDLCPDQTLLLDVSAAGGTYLWQDGSTAPTFAVTEPGIYSVIITTSDTTYSDTISVSPADCTPPGAFVLELPNVFTPNGDGIHDTFTPIRIENPAALHTTILNRWGSVVFETDALQIGWNGTSNGHAVSDGVYFWIVDGKGLDGTEVRMHGTVTVIVN